LLKTAHSKINPKNAMKKSFTPPKGFNTRKHLLDNAPYVRLLCEKMHTKIAAEWAEKWQPLGLGNSLAHCRNIRCYSAFIKALNQDIIATYNLQGHKEKIGIAESSLKRLLDSDKLPKFLQKSIRDMLMAYLGYESWEAFKRLYSNEVNNPPSEGLPLLPVQPTQKAPIIAISYIRFVSAYRFYKVNHTAAVCG
jgi:hypothetical protein